MAILTISGSGTTELRLRLQMAHAAIGLVVPAAVSQAGQYVADELKYAAPHGSSSEDTKPISGDAPGHLAESFEQQMLAMGADYAATQVVTTQPHKLKFVIDGHGEIVPTNKKALMWPGLPHPVRKAKAVPPNDFVTPVLEAGVAQAVALLEDAITTEVLTIVGGV